MGVSTKASCASRARSRAGGPFVGLQGDVSVLAQAQDLNDLLLLLLRKLHIGLGYEVHLPNFSFLGELHGRLLDLPVAQGVQHLGLLPREHRHPGHELLLRLIADELEEVVVIS